MPELDTDGVIRAFISDAHAIVAQHGGQVNDASLADIARRHEGDRAVEEPRSAR